MNVETTMAIAQSTPMPHRSENGVTVRYEAKVFSLWDRKASAEVTHACMHPIVWIPAFKCIAISFLERREATASSSRNCPAYIGERALREQKRRPATSERNGHGLGNAVLSEIQNDVEACVTERGYEAEIPTCATAESISSGLFSTVASRGPQAMKGKTANDGFEGIVGASGCGPISGIP